MWVDLVELRRRLSAMVEAECEAAGLPARADVRIVSDSRRRIEVVVVETGRVAVVDPQRGGN